MKVDEKVNSNNLSYSLKIKQLFIFLLKKQCPSNLEKVEQCYDGHVEVFKGFPGPTFSFGQTVLVTFRGQIDRLVYCSNSNSTIWSEGCTAIIKALSFLSNLGKNRIHFLNENGKATHDFFSTYRETVTNLSNNYIGELAKPINKQLQTLENYMAEILEQFHASLAGGHCGKINFKGVMKCGRRLLNIVALIAKTALNYCGCATITNDTFEAIAVLICISYDSMMAILAVIGTMAAEIYARTQVISDELLSYLRTLDHFINGIHKTYALKPTDTAQDARIFSTTLVDETVLFNQALDKLLGPAERVAITAVQVTKIILRSSDAHHRP